MTVQGILSESRRTLEYHDIDTPGLDAALLLAYAHGINREKLYMNLQDEVGETEFGVFQKMLERRVNGEPIAWITGVKEFWGLEFHLGPGILCPRPDSEILVETALEFMPELTSGHLHDCCCGPGTLAAAIAVERPLWSVSASDISEGAGQYFKQNNQNLTGGRMHYTRADLLDGIQGPFNIIVSNPPYLTRKEMSERYTQGWKEPVLALEGGGEDGLNLIRRLVHQASEYLCPDGVLLLEASPLQIPAVRQIMLKEGFEAIDVRPDIGARERAIYGRYRGVHGWNG